MTYSKALLGTNKKKATLNWWEYWIGHCWMTGWQSIRSAFRNWADLMGSNYDGYNILKTVDDSEQECLEWFWATLGEDEVYSKEFLEYLMQMLIDIDSGKEKLIPMEDVMKDLKDLEMDDEYLTLEEMLEIAEQREKENTIEDQSI